jgi:hypothetical protein
VSGTAQTTLAQAPSLLLQRSCTVTVGSLAIPAGQGTGLDVSFHVKRGIKITQGARKPVPNTCDLQIWNLSPDHRKAIEQSTVPGAARTVVPVTISAGYAGRVTTIFSGELRAGESTTDGPDIVTQLTTGDGDEALTQARLSIAMGPGTSAAQVLDAIVQGLGVGPGNVATAKQLLASLPNASKFFSKGVVLKGAAADIMSDFCRSTGLAWSVQNGALQVTELGQPVQGQAILIDADHGLVGSPTVDTTGLLRLRTLMLPDLFPGTKLSMNSLTVKGGYAVTYVETIGDTFGDDWCHEIEAERY